MPPPPSAAEACKIKFIIHIYEGIIMKPKTIMIIVLVIVITILSMQNTQPVILKILFWQPEFPLIILIFIALSIGFVAGYFTNSLLKVVKKKNDDY
jgi:uncharacterized integral membrane protein